MSRLKIACVFVLLVSVSAAAFGRPIAKKLIYFGWDMKSPAELETSIGNLQRVPFDGLAVRATKFCYTFYNKNVDGAAVKASVKAMSRIKWGKFTDNFMYMAPGDNVDWFDEAAWSDDGYILKNVRALARMGRAGKCKGIMFNPEFVYWGRPHDPWSYKTQARRKEKSVAEYRSMVRKRGAQFINAIEEYMPDTTFLTLFWGIKYSPVDKIAIATDPEAVNKIIAEASDYGLLHDFMLGMLDAADKGTTIVDGNEYSYYRHDFDGYNHDYHFIHQTMLGAVPEELRYKYRAQVSAGQAIYADLHSNTRGRTCLSTFMTPGERAMAMEWVVYNALKNSDKYVWFFAELTQYLKNMRVAPEMIPAIDRARLKVARNEEIGFDFKPIERRAGKAYNQAKSGDIKPSKAEIARAGAPPKIDGKLDDELWKKASQLGPFQNFCMATNPIETKTMAYMAYDDANLYIAFRCDDPMRTKPDVAEIDKEEEQRGSGHMVEVGIADDDEASNYYHIRLTYTNRRWDALILASVWPNEISGKNSSWDGKYETATYVDKNYAFWTVEMAIPWATLNRQAPKPGDRIKGNLILRTDRRASHGNYEFSSWSMMRRNRIIEAKTLGTWVFAD